MTSNCQGMRWFKCDLHVHTPEDGKNWDQNDPLRLPNPRRPRESGRPGEQDIQEKARRFLRRCHELELEVVGVTDHNFSNHSDARDWFLTHLLEQNKTIAKESGREPLWILPGFEIDIGYHVLCLFDPVRQGKHLTRIAEILTSLGLPPDQRFQNGCPRLLRSEEQNVSLRTVLKIVQGEYGGIVIAPHAFSDKGIANNPGNKDDYKNEELLCVEVTRYPLGEPEQSILSGKNPDWRRPNRQPSYVLSSDAKSLAKDEIGNPRPNSLGYRFTWIKMSRPSTEALRQAFLDNQSRIRLQDSSPERDTPHGRIVSFEIRDVAFLEDKEVLFSPNMNCLIGGRGTGKSTILEYIRMTVRMEDDFLAKPQVGRIRRTLKPSSMLTLRWRDSDDIEDRFEYSPGLVKSQVVGREVADPATVFKNLNIQIYSQRQISELARLDEHDQPAFLLPLIDRLCGGKLARLKQRETELYDGISQIFQQQRILRRLEQERQTLEQEMTELTRQWNALVAVQEESRKHRYAQEAARYLKNLKSETVEIGHQWNELAAELLETHLPIGSMIKSWPMPEYFQSLEKEVEKSKEQLVNDIRQTLERFGTRIRQLAEESAEWPNVQRAIRQAEQAFVDACEKQGLQPKDFERLREIDAERRVKNAEIEQKNVEIERIKKTVKKLNPMLEELHRVWRLQWQVRKEDIQRILASRGIRLVPRDPSKPNGEKRPFVDVIIQYSADVGHFLSKWNQLAPDGRTHLGRQWEEIGKTILNAFLKRAEQVHSPWALLEVWFSRPEVKPKSTSLPLGQIREHLYNNHHDLWEKTQLIRVKDGVDLILHREDGTVAGSLQNGGLSDGQRNTAVLSLLLAQGTGPVLIDQPEDELDSDFIFNELVPLLRYMKEHRQVILATHNANLPVNGDAELLYALEAKEGRGALRTQGGLDRDDVKHAVLDIMEGSEEAFRKRRDKYHF